MIHNSFTKDEKQLYAANTFEAFWQLLIEPRITWEEWREAIQKASTLLPMAPDSVEAETVIARVLGEATDGPKQWQLSKAKRLYYQIKMQALNIEYDLSFFDTDPHEPIAGGTMSIWPFQLGAFMELPYTLTQDNTLANILSAKTPHLWTDKVDFIEQWNGMVLVNTHPDYLRAKHCWTLYEDFLKNMQEREGYWHALPRVVARWWQQRMQLQVSNQDGQWDLSSLQGAVSALFSCDRLEEGNKEDARLVPTSKM